MTPPPTCDEQASLWRTWNRAAGDPAVDRAVRALYADLDAAVRARGPICWTSGRCCNFEAMGHRLYVTGLEIAWLLRVLPASPPSAIDLKGGCPFQVDKLCTVHALRPLGCRVFFCQHGTQDWQHDLYEQFLTRLRTLHDEHALPYRYMEWRTGLQEATEDQEVSREAHNNR